MTAVTEAGVYSLSMEEYHGDPVEGGSLSSSGARLLLPPSCPAKFAWERKHPRAPKHEFDIGHAAHMLVLGAGDPIVEIPFDSYRTKAAQEMRDTAYADGATPLLPGDVALVKAMAEAILRHPVAAGLFDQERGKPEQAMVWQDGRTGIWRRALLDWLPSRGAGRLIVPDYKTARSAEPEQFAKSAANFGYAQQAAWYLDGILALDLDDEPAFVFVVQEKEAPYLVTVVELDATALQIGRHLNRKAIDLYAECVATDTWPGYSAEVELVPLPRWYEAKQAEELFA